MRKKTPPNAAKETNIGLTGGVDPDSRAQLAAGQAALGAKQKVFVGLSGGVDSSVSAMLLKRAGYDVTGVFLRVWQPDFFECTWKDDRLDAMRVAAKLGIPFVELNLEKQYKKEVVDYMIREYKAGRTPNPDVMCNRFIKFGAFYDWARARGADFIATGHYARVGTREFPTSNSKFSNTDGKIQKIRIKNSSVHEFELLSGTDVNKDQSYFLWQIRREQLSHILFPVGGMQKTDVRALAKKAGLITADKKDSQGLCFVGKVDMKEFLSHFIKQKKGAFINERGETLGEHSGAFFYTIGERAPLSVGEPVYVTGKDMRKNTVTVAAKSQKVVPSGSRARVSLRATNWLARPDASATYSARTRYRQPLEHCRLEDDGTIAVFKKPQIVAAGQSLVVYEGRKVVGGGIIV